VREYVLSREGAMEFLDSYSKALVPLLEGYQRENKSHSTIAIGCTGGNHRSVAMVRNPATGETFTKAADKVVKMTIAKALKDSVNG